MSVQMPLAYILSTGTELSSGRSQDTNGPYLARCLSECGFRIAGLSLIPDDAKLLSEGIANLLNRNDLDLVIATGGLGPTEDDYTVDVLANLCKKELPGTIETIEEPESLARIQKLCKDNPQRFHLEKIRRQIRILARAKPLINDVGLAPGFIIEWPLANQENQNPCFFIALPGPPREMEAMFDKKCLPWLKRRFSLQQLGRADFYLYDIGEASFQARFFGIPQEQSLPSPIVAPEQLPADFHWGVSADLGSLKVFFESQNEKAIIYLRELVRTNFCEHFLSENLGDMLHKLCTEEQIKIATAESCSGGLVAKLITDYPGSSDYFMGSIVSYANQIKQSLLAVDIKLLEEEGAVSPQCALAMSHGAIRTLDTDYAVSVSGIAGPGGGSPTKPVGLVYLGFAAKNGTDAVHKLYYNLDRAGVRNYSAQMALFYFYRFLCSQLKA